MLTIVRGADPTGRDHKVVVLDQPARCLDAACVRRCQRMHISGFSTAPLYAHVVLFVGDDLYALPVARTMRRQAYTRRGHTHRSIPFSKQNRAK